MSKAKITITFRSTYLAFVRSRLGIQQIPTDHLPKCFSECIDPVQHVISQQNPRERYNCFNALIRSYEYCKQNGYILGIMCAASDTRTVGTLEEMLLRIISSERDMKLNKPIADIIFINFQDEVAFITQENSTPIKINSVFRYNTRTLSFFSPILIEKIRLSVLTLFILFLVTFCSWGFAREEGWFPAVPKIATPTGTVTPSVTNTPTITPNLTPTITNTTTATPGIELYVIVKVERLLVRETPHAQAPVVAVLNREDTIRVVDVHEISGEVWFKVSKDNIEGWIVFHEK